MRVGLFSAVRVTERVPASGIVWGRIGRYTWEARLGRKALSYGLNPQSLYKGGGRVARLVLYEEAGMTRQGEPVLRKVAVYNGQAGGWLFGRKRHLPVLWPLVRALERM